MKGAPDRVQVFSLGLPKPDVARENRRFRVKWRILGRDKTRAFKTKAEAERFRALLLTAVADGDRFDLRTGLPERWLTAPTGPTWWSWSSEWLRLRWPHWSGHSRRSAVETLSLFMPLLVRPEAPAPPEGFIRWLRATALSPEGPVDDGSAHLAWVEQWSAPLAELDPPLLEHALRVTTSKADGTPTAVSVARRRRNMLSTVLRAAVRRGIVPTNPLDRVEWRTPSRSLTLVREEVGTVELGWQWGTVGLVRARRCGF